MINPKKLIKMAKKWQKFAALQRKRIPFRKKISTVGSASSAVGKGHFTIYTANHRRFVVPLPYLKNAIFRQLLEMSEEEYGLPSDGPIILPCDSISMDYAIRLIRQGDEADVHQALIKSVARSRCSSSRCLYEGQMNQQLLIH